MELREALSQIAEIRRQMARTEVYRGLRSAPVAFSGVVACLAAGVQAIRIPEPSRDLGTYLALWVGAAAIGLVAAGAEMAFRSRAASRWSREQARTAVEQFLPCVVAGGSLTMVIARSAEAEAWMLPGLWSIVFGLGVFATSRLLPRAMFGVACYYLVAGLAALALAREDWALSPWAMGLPFGVGQFLAAAVLYRTLERTHGDE